MVMIFFIFNLLPFIVFEQSVCIYYKK